MILHVVLVIVCLCECCNNDEYRFQSVVNFGYVSELKKYCKDIILRLYMYGCLKLF